MGTITTHYFDKGGRAVMMEWEIKHDPLRAVVHHRGCRSEVTAHTWRVWLPGGSVEGGTATGTLDAAAAATRSIAKHLGGESE